MKFSRWVTKREEGKNASFLMNNEHDIHLWEVALNGPGLPPFHLLSSDEKQRAKKYRFEKHRLRYMKTRSVLRVLLAKYLSVSPLDVQFQYNQYGKPSLDIESVSSWIWFNVSHSGEYALMAFSWMGEVGVDIEYKKEFPTYKDIIEKFFSSNEKSFLSALPIAKQLDYFYRLWTRKEAYVKALGLGMSLAFDSFSMVHENNAFSNEFFIRKKGYIVKDLELTSEYAAAVAAQGDALKITQYKFEQLY